MGSGERSRRLSCSSLVDPSDALSGVLQRAVLLCLNYLHSPVQQCVLDSRRKCRQWQFSGPFTKAATQMILGKSQVGEAENRCLPYRAVWGLCKVVDGDSLQPPSVSPAMTTRRGRDPGKRPDDSDQFSPVAQSCPTLCDPMNPSMPGLPAHHQLPEFMQTHVH